MALKFDPRHVSRQH